MSAKSSKARLLLIEDDHDTREAVVELIRDEGFGIDAVRKVTEAFELVDKQSYSLILSDVWESGEPRWPEIERLCELAEPTPVAACTASRERPPPALAARLAFFLEKPFAPERLLSLLARYAGDSSAVDRYRAATVAYFDALTRKDWRALGELCSEDVRYYFPTSHPRYGRQVSGRSEFLEFSRETFEGGPFADARFEVSSISPLDSGVVADWVGTWNHAANLPARTEGSIVLKFNEAGLHRIGVRLDVERWISAQAEAASGPAPTPPRRA